MIALLSRTLLATAIGLSLSMASDAAVAPITRVINVPPDSVAPLFVSGRPDFEGGDYVIPAGTKLNVNEVPTGLPADQPFESVLIRGGVVNYKAPDPGTGFMGPDGFGVDSGELNFSDGFTGGIQVTSGRANQSGGYVASGFVREGAAYNISGGTLGMLESAGGQIVMSGGILDGSVRLGTDPFEGVSTAEPTRFTIVGGEMISGIFIVYPETIVEVKAGFDFGRLDLVEVWNDAEFGLFGNSFMIDGTPVDGLQPGEPFEVTQRNVTLSGLYQNGTPFSVVLSSDDRPDFGIMSVLPGGRVFITLEIPEPSTAILAVGLIAGLAMRRR